MHYIFFLQEPVICGGNATVLDKNTGELSPELYLNTNHSHNGSVVSFKIPGFKRSHKYEVTFTLQNSAGKSNTSKIIELLVW